jgi:acyl-coenzyme A thioesterase 13
MTGGHDDKVAAELAAFGGFMHKLGERVTAHGGGTATVEVDVTPALLNPVGVLHGGVLATLIDDAATYAIMSAHDSAKPGVTTDLSVSYLAATKEGTVVAEARTLKRGRTMAFASVTVRRAADGVTVATGHVTKFMA